MFVRAKNFMVKWDMSGKVFNLAFAVFVNRFRSMEIFKLCVRIFIVNYEHFLNIEIHGVIGISEWCFLDVCQLMCMCKWYVLIWKLRLLRSEIFWNIFHEVVQFTTKGQFFHVRMADVFSSLLIMFCWF